MGRIFKLIIGIFTIIGLIWLTNFGLSKTRTSKVKSEKNKAMYSDQEEVIYFAGGCFWGTEHFFKQVRGVKSTEVGYANGKVKDPTYKMVSTGTTGYAETVKVIYDPQNVDLDLLIDLYFQFVRR